MRFSAKFSREREREGGKRKFDKNKPNITADFISEMLQTRGNNHRPLEMCVDSCVELETCGYMSLSSVLVKSES